MEYKKIIVQTDHYDIVQWEFQGMPITFRLWKEGSGIIEIKGKQSSMKCLEVSRNG